MRGLVLSLASLTRPLFLYSQTWPHCLLCRQVFPSFLCQIFRRTCFPSSGPHGRGVPASSCPSLLASLQQPNLPKVCLCRLLMSRLSGEHSSAAQTGVRPQDSTETAQTQPPVASVPSSPMIAFPHVAQLSAAPDTF